MTGIKRKASESEDPSSAEPKIQKRVSTNELESQDKGNMSEHSEDDSGSENDEEEETEEKHSNTAKSSTTAAHDIHIARETAELFKSNIFKLQIDELLEQVKLKESHVLKVEKFLHKLYDMIQQVPDWEEHSITEVESFFKGKIVSVPFVDPKPMAATTNYKFDYKAPSVSLIGSFALKTGIYQPHGSAIDVLLTMPESLFEKKDFLNFRALHKRSVYLAYLTHYLSISFKKEKLDQYISLEYSYFNNDPLLPIVTISCKKAPSHQNEEYNFYKTRFSINLIIGFPHKIFDAKKLLPNKNCIRIAHDDSVSELPVTPLYNFAILSSTTYEVYLKYLYKTKKQTIAFKEAAVLGRLWLQQRGFSSQSAHSGSLGGFGTFEFTTLMATLLNGGGVNGNKILLHGFSSYQLFKGVIKYLATMDLCTDGHLQFSSEDENHSSKYIEEGFQAPTLFDKSTKVNILSKMTNVSYQALKMYAKETLTMLNNVVQDQFSNIFLTNISRTDNLKYDHCFDLLFPLGTVGNSDSFLSSNFGPLERIKFITIENFIVNKITNVVKIALGDRINLIEVKLQNVVTTFPISRRKVHSSSGGNNFNFEFIKLKLLVNPDESEKLVTKGPAHSEEATPEAIFFKSFWGPKSSLRRFKDGSITHCCVWSTSSSEPIISSILNFALKKHVSEKMQINNTITKEFQDLLPLPNLPASSTTSVLNLTSFYNLKKSFDNLYKVVFKMTLPLSIKSILPVGPAFRYTSLCQPVPFAYSDPDFFQDVILEFETSPKWPDEITSLEKAKTAFPVSYTHLDVYKRQVLVNGLIWSEVSCALILERVGEEYVVVSGLVPSCSYDIQFVNRLDQTDDYLISDLMIRTSSILNNDSSNDKTEVSENFENLDFSFPSYYHRKFLSPLLTLKHSVLTTNANLADERNKIKKTKKEINKKLNSLRQEIDHFKGKIEQNATNDEKNTSKVDNLKIALQQNEKALKQLEEDLKRASEKELALEEDYLTKKDYHLQKELEFSKLEESLNKDLSLVKAKETKLQNEYNQLSSKKDKLSLRHEKLQKELDENNELFTVVKEQFVVKRENERLKRQEARIREISDFELGIKGLEQDISRLDAENDHIQGLLNGF